MASCSGPSCGYELEPDLILRHVPHRPFRMDFDHLESQTPGFGAVLEPSGSGKGQVPMSAARASQTGRCVRVL